jgi:hypothetical protein
MAASHKEKLSPKYRIIVQDTEHKLAAADAAPVERYKGNAEHMFNMLNSWVGKGKNSPRVCKFIDSLSAFWHGIQRFRESLSYLLEQMGLRNRAFQPVGLRIAFSIARPTFLGIRSGKD